MTAKKLVKTKRIYSTKEGFGFTIEPKLHKLIKKKYKEDGISITVQLDKAFRLLYPEYKG